MLHVGKILKGSLRIALAKSCIDDLLSENPIQREPCKIVPMCVALKSVAPIRNQIQGHLDRHLRSTTHMSMEEAVRRTGRRPNTE